MSGPMFDLLNKDDQAKLIEDAIITAIAQDGEPVAWRYRDSSGTHLTEDKAEILAGSPDEWSELFTPPAIRCRQGCAELEEDLRINRAVTCIVIDELRQQLAEAQRIVERQRSALEEMVKELRSAESRNQALQAKTFARFNNEDCWIYLGDDTDDLDSLVCPVVISAKRLSDILAEHEAQGAKLAEAERLCISVRATVKYLRECPDYRQLIGYANNMEELCSAIASAQEGSGP